MTAGCVTAWGRCSQSKATQLNRPAAWRDSDLHVRQMLAIAQHNLARSGEAEKALGVKL